MNNSDGVEKLSFKSYVSKCVLGSEIVYVLCLVGGFCLFEAREGGIAPSVI